ncbi:MAG: CAP domain-containing protein, partial [Akkermansia muciniphila]
KSEGHRANILNERFTKIGIASKKNNNQYGGYTWEQLFIS